MGWQASPIVGALVLAVIFLIALSMGAQRAFYLAAAGLVLRLLVSLIFSRRANGNVQATTA